jgi:hypothetical protein
MASSKDEIKVTICYFHKKIGIKFWATCVFYDVFNVLKTKGYFPNLKSEITILWGQSQQIYFYSLFKLIDNMVDKNNVN